MLREYFVILTIKIDTTHLNFIGDRDGFISFYCGVSYLHTYKEINMDVLVIKDNGDTIINLPRIESMTLEKKQDLAYNLDQLCRAVVQSIMKDTKQC